MRKKLKKVLYILDITAECVMISIEANKNLEKYKKFVRRRENGENSLGIKQDAKKRRQVPAGYEP